MSTHEDMLKGLMQCGLIKGYKLLDGERAEIMFKQPLAYVGIDFGFEPDKQTTVLYDRDGKVIENPFIDPAEMDKLKDVYGRPPRYRCPVCKGRGTTQQYGVHEQCPACRGTGEPIDYVTPDPDASPYCDGTGRRRRCIPYEHICMCGSPNGYTNARCSTCGGLIK